MKPTPVMAVLLALFMAACSTAPTSTPLLDQSRGDFMGAQSDPLVGRYAASELRQAGMALDQASAAAARREPAEQVDQLAYLARQQIATAREVARRRLAEAEVADAARQREQILLAQRSREAEQARQQAASAEAAASSAREQAAALQRQLADLQTSQTERGLMVTFADLLFQVGQAQLSPAGMHTARKLAEVLNRNPDSHLLVEGYTDSSGSAAHNLRLSQQRADAVRDALVGMGVAPERIATRGYGEAYPVVSNDTASRRQLNRRVEIILSASSAPIGNRH